VLLDFLPQLVAKAKAATSGWGVPGWVTRAIADDEHARERAFVARRAAAVITAEDDDEEALLMLAIARRR